MCFPPKSEILKKTKKIVKKAKAKRVFVATDNDPMIKELSNALKSLKVRNCFVCFEQRHQGVAKISTGAVVLSSFPSRCGLYLSCNLLNSSLQEWNIVRRMKCKVFLCYGEKCGNDGIGETGRNLNTKLPDQKWATRNQCFLKKKTLLNTIA